MARLGPLLLKGAGALLLAFILLSVVATVVGILLSIVATVVAAVVTLAMLAAVVLAIFGLVSLLRSDDAGVDTNYSSDSRTRSAGDSEETLRSKYVAGELSDAEFERELDHVLKNEEVDRADRLERELSDIDDPATDRTRLWDR